MILAPSEIHFLKDAAEGLLSPDADTVARLKQKFQMGEERIPKVQVASKDGFWFALNNSYLHILRELQKQGKCARVCVEVVPLTKVPESVQEGMVVSKEDYILWADGVTRQVTSRKMASDCTKDSCEDSPSSISKASDPIDSLCSSVGCQAYQDKEDGYRLSAECLAENALLEALDSETDASSYSSTDYSDYDNEDEENDDEDEEDDSDSEYEEDLICNVCESIFESAQLLLMHQEQSNHFACSMCSQKNFGSHRALQLHKDIMEHWSQDEDSDSAFKTKDEEERDTTEDEDEPFGDQMQQELKSLL